VQQNNGANQHKSPEGAVIVYLEDVPASDEPTLKELTRCFATFVGIEFVDVLGSVELERCQIEMFHSVLTLAVFVNAKVVGQIDPAFHRSEMVFNEVYPIRISMERRVLAYIINGLQVSEKDCNTLYTQSTVLFDHFEANPVVPAIKLIFGSTQQRSEFCRDGWLMLMRLIDEWMHGCMDGCMDAWMDGLSPIIYWPNPA
jgi:hypothetical protein